jgi:hypothetical protein
MTSSFSIAAVVVAGAEGAKFVPGFVASGAALAAGVGFDTAAVGVGVGVAASPQAIVDRATVAPTTARRRTARDKTGVIATAYSMAS